jgi:hypothetical protein
VALAGYTYLLTHKHLVELHLQGMLLTGVVLPVPGVRVARPAKGRRHHVFVSPAGQVKLKDSSSDNSSSSSSSSSGSGTTNANYVHDEAPGFVDLAGCVGGSVTMFVVQGGLHGSIPHPFILYMLP